MKTKTSLFRRVFLCSALSLLTMLPSFAARIPIEITCDGPSEVIDGIAYAQDNVNIKYDGLFLKADRIEFNTVTREVRLYKKGGEGSDWTFLALLQIENKE